MKLAERQDAYAAAVGRHYELRRESVAVVEDAARAAAPGLTCPVCEHRTLDYDGVNPNYRGNTGVLAYFVCRTCKRRVLLDETGTYLEESRG